MMASMEVDNGAIRASPRHPLALSSTTQTTLSVRT